MANNQTNLGLLKKYGSAFPQHFNYASKTQEEVMGHFVTKLLF